MSFSTRTVLLDILFALLLLLLAAWIATAGIRWSVYFHPDEPTIARWFSQVAESGYITERAYPSGWFELHRLHGCRYASVPSESSGEDDEEKDDSFENDEPDPPGKRARWLDRHLSQAGSVNTHFASTFRPIPTDGHKPPLDSRVQDGRSFNAILYVASVLLVFLACLESGLRPLPAFVSGLFLCASAAPIEFAHYCETDAGLIVTLCFFAWISARTLRRGSPALALASGFAAGFAFSCKFSLAPLLLWCLVLPVALAVRRKGTPLRRATFALTLAAGSLALAAAGYAIGTPALLIAPDWYAEAVRHTSNRTYSEITANLGGVYDPWNAVAVRIVQFVRETTRLGALPILWGLFAWSFWLRPAFRRQAAGVPLLLPLFVPFAVFAFPFVRNQETLPVPILLAIGAGLPLEWWLRRRVATPRPSGRLRATAAVCVALAALALTDGMLRAHGMLSCFRVRDTRAEAQNWLLASLPRGARIGCDRYTGQSLSGVPCNFEDRHALPYRWISARAETNLPPYFIENVGFEGRLPLRDRRTGRFLPSTVANLEAWRNDSLELRRWTFPNGLQRPTFAQPDIRIVALSRPGPDAVDLPLAFDRPMLLLPPGVGLYDFDGAPGLGAVRAETIVGKRCAVHVSRRDARRWLVTSMLRGDEEATIACERPFRPTKARLRAGGTVATERRPAMRKSLSRLLARGQAFPSARVRMRGDDQTLLCAARLCADPAETARALRTGGDPARALEVLDEAARSAPLDTAALAEAFLSARMLGSDPNPEWTDAAKTAVEAVASAREGREISIRGIPLDVVRDFSRLRLASSILLPGDSLPVFLPPGEYDVFVPLPAGWGQESAPPRLFEDQTEDGAPVPIAPERIALRCPVRTEQGTILRCVDAPFAPFKSSLVEIVWNPLDSALGSAKEINEALVRPSISRNAR